MAQQWGGSGAKQQTQYASVNIKGGVIVRRFLRFFVAQVEPAITGTATTRDTCSSRNESRPLNWASVGLLLSLLAASQFSAQTSMSKEWTTISKGDSNVYFSGVDQPEILTAKTKSSDDNMSINELLLLKTDLTSHSSFIYLQIIEAGVDAFDVYDSLKDKAAFSQIAQKWVPQGTVGEVKSRENIEGKYIYVAVKIDQGEKCVVALQGYDSLSADVDIAYPIRAIVHFKYCSNKTEKEILDKFDSIRVKD